MFSDLGFVDGWYVGVASQRPRGRSIRVVEVPELTFCVRGIDPEERTATEDVSIVNALGQIYVRPKNFGEGPSPHVEAFGGDLPEPPKTIGTRRSRLNDEEWWPMDEYSRGYLKTLIRIDESPNPTVAEQRQLAIGIVRRGVLELVDTIFVEEEDPVSANLQRRRKLEYETPYKKPKQEVGLS